MTQLQENCEDVDRLPVEYRQIVHEFGFAIYRALITAGVTRPSQMRQLVHEIWHGARGSTRGGKPRGYPGAANLSQLDWLLIQTGSNVSAATLVGILKRHGFILVPHEPSPGMIDASMDTVSDFDVKCTKREKHRRRLRAAHDAAVAHFWPFLVKTTPRVEAAE